LTQLPIDTVQDANFSSYFYGVAGTWVTQNVAIGQITNSWDEVTVTGNTAPTRDGIFYGDQQLFDGTWKFYDWPATTLVLRRVVQRQISVVISSF